MSLILTESNYIRCTMNPFKDTISIDDKEITNDDFCALVYYFFTNTDLKEDDFRLDLINVIKNSTIVDGYNAGGKRISFDKKL